jgi:hypothetical protein
MVESLSEIEEVPSHEESEKMIEKSAKKLS